MRTIGYHGTSVHAARDILASGFESSRNDYDWLGDGAYFFQDAPCRAMEWARERFGPDAVVVAAEIDLEDCIDLLDIPWEGPIRSIYLQFAEERVASGQPFPRQTSGAHRLDRAVFNYAARWLIADGRRVRSLRAVFPEGVPLFPGSSVLNRGHVQIVVRDMDAITRAWDHGKEVRNA